MTVNEELQAFKRVQKAVVGFLCLAVLVMVAALLYFSCTESQ